MHTLWEIPRHIPGYILMSLANKYPCNHILTEVCSTLVPCGKFTKSLVDSDHLRDFIKYVICGKLTFG